MHDETVPRVWELRSDVFWVRLLLALASLGALEPPRPETHYYLFDRYLRLSEHHRARGRTRRAERLRRIADWHYECSGYDTPPPAVASALPLPRRPAFTWAVSSRPEPPEPPDAA